MALLANTPQERVEQMLLLTERLTALIDAEATRIEARQPPLQGAEDEERNRLANAYRLELARIKQDPALISGAAPPLLAKLRHQTEALHAAMARHQINLEALKAVAEGLVQAMAEEVNRQRQGAGQYGAKGAMSTPPGPTPTVLDRSA